MLRHLVLLACPPRRRLLAAVSLLGLACTAPALAADYPVLRGTQTPALPPLPVLDQSHGPDWNGFYVGAFGSYNAADIRPNRSAAPLINAAVTAAILDPANRRDATPLITQRNLQAQHIGFGGFLGYNIASEDALFGIETDYQLTRLRTNMVTPGPVTTLPRFLGDPDSLTVNSANTNTRIDGIFTVRGRVGAIYGNLMPYLTGGLAIAHGSTMTTGNFVHTNVPTTSVFEKRSVVWTGGTIGAGLEAMVGNIVLRGEYLFTRLQAPNNASPITLNQARFGAGVKF